MNIAIVGAGMAGLACATRLSAAGCRVRLFDKGRRPGGRVSTRRADVDGTAAAFDHGAQYFTVRDPRFAAEVRRWADARLAARWAAAGPDAWVGTPAMDAPAHALARSLAITADCRVERPMREDGRWRLDVAGRPLFDALVVAVPAEQAAALLADIAPTCAARAAAVPTLPCWTLMAAFAERLAPAADVIRGDGDAALAWAARDSAKPGRAPGERWVVQAGARWSQDHLEHDRNTVAALLVAELGRLVGAPVLPRYRAAHRWRYARTTAASPAVLWDGDTRLGVCGDWCGGGARVESAWLSGEDLAHAILQRG